MGGMASAIELYYPQRAIHASAVRDQRDVESGQRRIVGVNVHADAAGGESEDIQGFIEELRARRGFEQRQIGARSRASSRSGRTTTCWASLEGVKRAARAGRNMMPSLIDAVSTYATMGENTCCAAGGVGASYREIDVTSPGLSTTELRDVVDGRRFSTPVRFLLAKGGLDGHTRGIWVLVDLLRAMGAEVVYAGLHCSMSEIAKAAVEEDVDAIGLSSHIGSPVVFYSRLKEELTQVRGATTVLISGGGIMAAGRSPLPRTGARGGSRSFLQTPRLEEVADRLIETLSARSAVGAVLTVASFHAVGTRPLRPPDQPSPRRS